MTADLHCHTKMSDGSVSIDELIALAGKKGIGTLAVTDHDTFAGSTRAKIFGQRHGVQVIPGAELSAFDTKRGRKVHVLCYYSEHPERLEGLCRRTAENRRKASIMMLQKVMRLYPINAEMVARRGQGSTNIFKQHIMHALMDAGYADSIFGDLFHKLFDRDGLANVSVKYPDVYSVLGEIHGAGGVAVLAHPGVYDSYELLEELAKQGLLEGVEVFHPRNKPGDVEQLTDVAGRYGLAMTGGTDFHGMYSSSPAPLGTCTTPEEQLDVLKKCRDRLVKQQAGA